MARVKITCVDAGSDYCPCYLAELGECIMCSQLQGKSFCNCTHQGVCIYQEFIWSGEKIKASRKVHAAQILQKHYITEKALLFKLKVPKTLARHLNEPGAFIFMRDRKYPQFFDVPMSIMESDDSEGIISVAVQIMGVKTKALNNVENHVLVKGPYWNGILGKQFFKAVSGAKCLVIAKGIAQAPALPVVKKLLKNHNHVEVILDEGKLGKIFADKYLDSLVKTHKVMNLNTYRGKNYLENRLRDNKIKLVFCGGPDKLHRAVKKMLQRFNPDAYLAVTNNISMCCGEGVCGSCSKKLDKNVKVRVCKTQLDVKNPIEGRILNG